MLAILYFKLEIKFMQNDYNLFVIFRDIIIILYGCIEKSKIRLIEHIEILGFFNNQQCENCFIIP